MLLWIFLKFYIANIAPAVWADQAREHIHGSHAECPLPKTFMDVVRCARERHPQAQKTALSLGQAKNLEAVAKTIQNPELSVESISGEINDEKRSENKLTLLQSIEIGGKRSARVQIARSQMQLAEGELRDVQSQVSLDAILKLYRLKQLEHEQGVLAESIETFSQVVRQQRLRQGPSSEQKVALSVFKMALAETKLRQSALLEEEKALENYFHIVTGHSLKELKPILPDIPKDWPSPGETTPSKISPGLQVAQVERDLAQAELNSAQSASWPEFKIGPSLLIEEDNGSRGNLFGVQLSMDLPVFNWNGAGRALGQKGVEKAVGHLNLMRIEEDHAREEQVWIYTQALQVLKETPIFRDLEKEHKQHEIYVRRGLISPALVIESHRQMEEFVRTRHQRELKALEALWTIRKLDGRLEDSIQENL